MTTLIVITILLAIACGTMATIEIKREIDHNRRRRERRSKKQCSCVPLDAADRLNAFLNVDKSKDKEFKLAVLIVEDSNGNKTIEDMDLRGDSAEKIKLSDFAINKYKHIASGLLFDNNVLNTIANKVNCMIAETERYYAFELTKENVLSGRHGKSKKKITNDYVMLLDLNEKELKQIANLSF